MNIFKSIIKLILFFILIEVLIVVVGLYWYTQLSTNTNPYAGLIVFQLGTLFAILYILISIIYLTSRQQKIISAGQSEIVDRSTVENPIVVEVIYWIFAVIIPGIILSPGLLAGFDFLLQPIQSSALMVLVASSFFFGPAYIRRKSGHYFFVSLALL